MMRAAPHASGLRSIHPPTYRSVGVPARRNTMIPPRLELDLVQVRVARQGAQPVWGERVPGGAERIDDRIVAREQAVAEVSLAQEEPDPLDRVQCRAVGRQEDERDVVRNAQGV